MKQKKYTISNKNRIYKKKWKIKKWLDKILINKQP